MKSFQEFMAGLTEDPVTEDTEQLTEVTRFPLWLVKNDSKTIAGFDIEEPDGSSGSATGIAGKVKTGEHKGKYAAYIVSFDLDLQMKGDKHYDTLETAVAALPAKGSTIKFKDLTKTFDIIQ